MSGEEQQPGPMLYVIACATPAARDVGKLVGLAQERGWRVCVIATPSALAFIDEAGIEEQTGFVVRHKYKKPGTPDVLPPADAMIVGGASFNMLNKWALGISDTLALGLINEGIGLGIPIVALPFLNAAQAAHPAFGRNIEVLRSAGVTVLLGAGLRAARAPPRLEVPVQVSVAGGAGRRRSPLPPELRPQPDFSHRGDDGPGSRLTGAAVARPASAD